VDQKKNMRCETLDNVQHLLRENSIQIDERLSWLYDEIYKLDEIDRSVTLLLLEGFSYKQMSAILGLASQMWASKSIALKNN
jgi:RNA polymerase sigma-70 factor (ECF subfamily)